jgi:hypothetical protein
MTQQDQQAAPPRRGSRFRMPSRRPAPAGAGAPSAPSQTGGLVRAVSGTTSRGIRQITQPLTRGIEQVAGQTEGVWRPVASILRWVSPLGWTILALGVA